MNRIIKTYCFHKYRNYNNYFVKNDINILLELISYSSYCKYNNQKIIFFTDKLGLKIFKDIFELDYEYICIPDDKISSEDFFCVPKLFAYKKIVNNFIHIDCDVVFTGKCSFDFEGNDLIFINSENHSYMKYHNQIRNVLIKENIYCPDILRKNFFHLNIYNMGVFGVNEKVNISNYYDDAIIMYRNMRSKMSNIVKNKNYNFGYFCAIPEQYLMGSYIQEKKLKCKELSSARKEKLFLTHIHYNKSNSNENLGYRQILNFLNKDLYLKWLEFIKIN